MKQIRFIFNLQSISIHSSGKHQTTLTFTLKSSPPWVTAIRTDTSHPVARAVVFAMSTLLLAVTAVVAIRANCGNNKVKSVLFVCLFAVEMSPAISLAKAVQLSLPEELSTSTRTVLVESAEALCQQLR